jgi:hypothetical protein
VANDRQRATYLVRSSEAESNSLLQTRRQPAGGAENKLNTARIKTAVTIKHPSNITDHSGDHTSVFYYETGRAVISGDTRFGWMVFDLDHEGGWLHACGLTRFAPDFSSCNGEISI